MDAGSLGPGARVATLCPRINGCARTSYDLRETMSNRSDDLAVRLEAGAQALIDFAGGLTPAEWDLPMPKDGRTLGVIIHHVASVYPVEIELAMTLASGRAISGVVPADIDAMNAGHARMHARATQEETLGLLLVNSATAAAAIRALSDRELDSAAPASLYGNAPVTCQFVLEDHAVRHSYHHLAKLREVVEAARTPALRRSA